MKSVGGTLVLKNPTAVKALSWSKKYTYIRQNVGWGSKRKSVIIGYPLNWGWDTPQIPTTKVPSLTLRKLAHKIEGKSISIEETKIFLSEEKRRERIQVSY